MTFLMVIEMLNMRSKKIKSGQAQYQKDIDGLKSDYFRVSAIVDAGDITDICYVCQFIYRIQCGIARRVHNLGLGLDIQQLDRVLVHYGLDRDMVEKIHAGANSIDKATKDEILKVATSKDRKDQLVS